jgi:predicted permease
MRKSPGFTIVVVLTAAFGITLSTLIFTILNASILRPLPHVRNPDELVKVFRVLPSVAGSRYNFSYADFETIRERATLVEDVVAVVSWVEFMARVGSDIDRQIIGAEVSENYFQMLGIPMAIGRGIVPEDADSVDQVAVIGHAMWQREFAGDSDALGQIIRINGRRYTIVGVAPPGLNWLNEEPVEATVWIPISPRRKAPYAGQPLRLAARRRPEVTVAEVQAEFDALAAGLAEANPAAWVSRSGEQTQVRVMTDLESRINMSGGRTLASLLMYLVLVGMTMLITCSNVANLLLTRALKRRSEIAVRLAMGAGRRRLVRQLLTESLVVFLLAGFLGLLLIHWVTQLLAVGWGYLPIASDVTVDGRVAAFVIAVAVSSGLFFGLAPALQATRADLATALKDTGKTLRFRRFGARNLFVLGQVAGSMVLVAISALLLRDVQLADTLDIGFDPDNVTVLSLNLNHGDYDADAGRRFLQGLTERLERTPGVEAVAIAHWVPMSGSTWTQRVVPEGYDPASQDLPWSVVNGVTPGFFDLVGIPLMAGRDFTADDDADAPLVMIVNEAFAARFWPDQAPVGKTVQPVGYSVPAVVVGVVGDARYSKADFAGEVTSPHYWFSSAQVYEPDSRVHIGTRGDQASIMRSIRDDVRALDPDLPIVELASMRDITERALEEERIAAVVLGGFGAAALLLAMMGIYGALAFAVVDRTRELGVRLALGARPERLVAMVVAQGLRTSAVGIVVGLFLSVLVAMGMQSLLVGVGTLDPVSLGGSVVLLALAAVVASVVPAVRAASVDPIQSLRVD